MHCKPPCLTWQLMMIYCINSQLNGKESPHGCHRYSQPAHGSLVSCFCCSTHCYFQQERPGCPLSRTWIESEPWCRFLSSVRTHGACLSPASPMCACDSPFQEFPPFPCLGGHGLNRQKTLGGGSVDTIMGSMRRDRKERAPSPNFTQYSRGSQPGLN